MKALISVLMFAASLSANAAALSTQTVSIKQVVYQEGSWEITVIGQLSNGCLSAPRPVLVPHPQLKNTFELQVHVVKSGEMCAMVVRGPFAEKADLRALVQKTGAPINPEQVYTIYAEGTNFSASFKGRDVLAYKPQASIEGTLLSARNGQLAVMTDEQRLVLLDDSMVSARGFVNQQVVVTGHMVRVSHNPRQVAPMVHIQPSLPLNRMVVLSIAAVE